MERAPFKEFGKRAPPTVVAAAAPPVKRSRHVALLLTGAFAVGGCAYALMPGGKCEPTDPATAATALPSTNTPCQPRSSSSGVHSYSHGWWSRSSFYGGDSASPATSTSTASGSGEVTRGGFGGFARAFAAHFSGT